MSTLEKQIHDLRETLRLQGTLIAVLAGLLIRTGALTKEQIAEELEHALGTGSPDNDELLTLLQASLSPRN
jgi:hypothetical protein